MTANEARQLVKLSETDRTVALGEEDIRGFVVKDRDGEDLGKVDDLLIDPEGGRVRFLLVASGGFLGIGKEHSFIPVDAVAGIGAEEVTVDLTREHVAVAPGYDPELSSNQAFQEAVYGHYNYTPYWMEGYFSPRFPPD
ncbi:PRC-barrel domain-containing protein [Arthrobacter sp. 2MCAF14]|uniref:PRC-barrel domain-containing protein n=1 Tax=Arthrobacter sp. 2MCAF14 TaxID=3232982 RepID=UPI003F93A772